MSAVEVVSMDVAEDQSLADWVFEVNPPMSGAAGEAFTNTLASPGMPPAAVLAREAIQNSVDAKAKGAQKVAVEFVAKALIGKEKSDFVKLAGLHALRDRAKRLDLKEPNCLAALSNSKAPLSLLFVNDHNTTGLAGDPSNPESKFSRFMLSLGDGGKEHDEHGTGGSYGFGKSVYSSNSGILTIFAYSRTVDGRGKPLSLLFGCGYYRKHTYGDQYFTGRAWFGEDKTLGQPGAHQIVTPLTGSEADRIARGLGFPARSSEDLGTSVLIVDARVDTTGILAGVEDWWWPRLVSGLLDVTVVDASGKEELPRPRKREGLRPFLEAFDVARGVTPPNSKTEFVKPFRKLDGLGIGAAGFKVLERREDNSYVVGEERTDAVALIRSPLMVVAYHRRWYVGNPIMAGAFLAHDDIDDILRAAEPPAHDRWDPDARRLHDEGGRKRQIVERVLSGVRNSLKECQKTASPPPPPRPKRLSVLERTLASFLSGAKRGSGKKPDPSTAPINLTYDQEPQVTAVGSELRLKAAFSVRLKSDHDADTMTVRVRVTCPIVEDGQEGDSLAVKIQANVPLMEDPDDPNWAICELLQGKTTKFDCETEAYNPLWTVRFVPEVEAKEIKA